MFGIGFQEMLIILVVVLIFFGPKRLPDLAKSLGKGIAEFKKASDEVRKGIDEAVREGETEAGAQAGTVDAPGPEAPAPPAREGDVAGAPGGAPAQETSPPDLGVPSGSATAGGTGPAPQGGPGAPPSAPAG